MVCWWFMGAFLAGPYLRLLMYHTSWCGGARPDSWPGGASPHGTGEMLPLQALARLPLGLLGFLEPAAAPPLASGGFGHGWRQGVGHGLSLQACLAEREQDVLRAVVVEPDRPHGLGGLDLVVHRWLRSVGRMVQVWLFLAVRMKHVQEADMPNRPVQSRAR